MASISLPDRAGCYQAAGHAWGVTRKPSVVHLPHAPSIELLPTRCQHTSPAPFSRSLAGADFHHSATALAAMVVWTRTPRQFLITDTMVVITQLALSQAMRAA